MAAKITILGTGAWGTSLANVLLENKHEVAMWGIDEHELQDLEQQVNTKYYSDKKLCRKPHLITNDLKEAVNYSEIILLAIPSKFLPNILEQVKKILKNRKVILVNVAKGIDPATKTFWSQVIKKIFSKNLIGLVSLLGPSFAVEVFEKELTVINAVGTNEKAVSTIVKIFSNNYFKLVPLKDEVGADLFAALKNVAAIGTGIVYQLHHSINTRSAIVACVFKEIAEIYQKLAKKKQLPVIGFELCAIGDLVLTCTSEKSRNFRFGLQVGEHGVNKALKLNKLTVEGYLSAKMIYDILRKNKIKAPIIEQIYGVLYQAKDPEKFAKVITKS
ncbi:NAD(P)H-dependent glycerol-3-phosphate dehydrogenase [[Mycoplasma] testudinis]|uniref:NAD(P)H-dependent glycerol-3-phosphate dehydrogenase n=1 Tax=[Mycoplasma] testudinis TaxID=33924 RepID=UPI00047FA1BB|nr:NAD(P)H-dependent glycerol-3-phosphate dehydrogenase [[Mycoplasma] testudinis]